MAKRVATKKTVKPEGKTGNEDKTRKVGRGVPPKGVQFSADNQPTPQAKSEGKRKKRNIKDLANALLTGKGKERAKEIAEMVGIDLSDDEYTAELIATLGQLAKAMNTLDTTAYNAVMDRISGKVPTNLKIEDTTPKKDYGEMSTEELERRAMAQAALLAIEEAESLGIEKQETKAAKPKAKPALKTKK